MNKNYLNSITYVHSSESSRWVAFSRVYNTRYYDFTTYEREQTIKNIFNRHSQTAKRIEFSFHGNETIIRLEV
jgi:hypothetical protein